jgi:hypothetical protein
MVSNSPKRRRQKKSPRKKRVKGPVFASGIVASLQRQTADHWPNLGGYLARFIRVSREKIDDLYSLAAQAVTEHKEAFEDRLAERKARARAAQQQSGCVRPIRPGVRDDVEEAAIKSPAIRRAPKKPTRSSAPRSS